MRRATKEKTRKDQKKLDRIRGVRSRLVELLQGLGLPAASLSPLLVEALQQRRYGELAIQPADAPSSEANVVFEELQASLQTARVLLAPGELEISVREFFSDYLMVVDVCRAGLDAEPEAQAEWQVFSDGVLPHAAKNTNRALHALIFAVESVLLRYCHIDGTIYSVPFAYGKDPSGKPRMGGALQVHVATPTTFLRDGTARPAWRCGLPSGADGIEWISWPASVRGATEADGSLDVFLQSHALKQLYERVPIEPWAVQDYMWQCLRAPVLTPQGAGRWLVEFRLNKWKLGYFTAEEVDGKVLITTFLFLTMSGTPEGSRLRRQLRIVTGDIKWIGMDTMHYYTHSDIKNDADLCRVFDECGCGHLFQMLKPGAVVEFREGVALRTRRHLMMPLPRM